MTAATVALKPWLRFRFGGSQAELAADVTQNEALEGIVTTVADVELETTITLATGLPVDLMYVEQISELMAWQFSGTVNHVAGQSFPNRVVLTCVGPLAHLRRCPTVDHDLTGMTEGEAAQHILTACNVTYTASDIADSGYVLGAQTPVLWLKDQPGHEMLAELDAVFGMATIEVGQGRVVRFAYDKAPDAAAITTTYTRGADVAFWGNQRDKGDFDSIINLVQVRGATWTDSGNKCNYTPWARGSANNADLGGTARNRSQAFQSDLIQDEALATAVATRLMRWGNRQPDTITLVAQNDPTLNCGAVIGVKDSAYGIGLTGDATATPYLVLTIDRRGHEMTLNCVGGAAGDTGAITHGVEKVCNKTSSNFPIPGLFTPPDIGYPPLGIGDWLPWAAGTDGAPGDADETSGGGTDTAGCVTPDAANWHELQGTLSYDVGEIVLGDMSGQPEAHFVRDPGDFTSSGTPINPPTKVTITGHMLPSGAGVVGVDAPLIEIGLIQDGADNSGVMQATWDPQFDAGFFYLYGFGGAFHQIDVPMSVITDGCDFALVADAGLNTLSLDVNSGAYAGSITLGDFTDAELSVYGTSGTALSATLSALSVCFGDPLFLVGDWVADSGAGNHSFGNDYDHISPDGSAHNTSVSVAVGDPWTLTATVSPSTVNSAQVGLGADGLSFEYYALIYATSDGGGLEVGSLAEDTFDATDLSGAGTVALTLAYDGGSTLTATFDGGTAGTVTISCAVDNATYPPATPLNLCVRGYTTAGGGSRFDGLRVS